MSRKIWWDEPAGDGVRLDRIYRILNEGLTPEKDGAELMPIGQRSDDIDPGPSQGDD